MWAGIVAAPAAWTFQHVAGIQLRIAQCHDNTAGPGGQVHVDTWTLVVTAAAAAVAVLGEIAAIGAWRATRGAEEDDAPPRGRIHFLGVVGLTISPLFLAIILMSGLGSVLLPRCVQS
jgi:hypothetical protein